MKHMAITKRLKVLTSIIFVVMMISTTTQVVAINYNFEENFEVINVSDWYINGIDYAAFNGGVGPATEITPQITIQDGKLVSSRPGKEPQKRDIVFHNLDMTTGAWQFTATTFTDYGDKYFWRFVLLEEDPSVWYGEWIDTIDNQEIDILFGHENWAKVYEYDFNIPVNGELKRETAVFELDSQAATLGKEHQYHVILDNGVLQVYVDYKLQIDYELKYDWNIQYFGIKTPQPLNMDNVKTTTDVEGVVNQINAHNSDTNKFPWGTALIIGSAIFVATFVSLYVTKKNFRRRIMRIPPFRYFSIRGEISQLQQQQSFILTLLTGLSKSQTTQPKLAVDDIPLEIFQFKFLMQPVRLAIMKLLYKYDKLSSVEIKTALKLSWSEYHGNVKALLSKQYISVVDEFEDYVKRQVVYIETAGSNDYEELTKLLESFSGSTLDDIDIIETSNSDKQDKLYPTSS